MGDIARHRPVYWFGKLATRQSDGATFDLPVSKPWSPENTNPLGLWRTNHSHCPSPLRSAVTQVVSSPERRISPPGLRALMRWSSVVVIAFSFMPSRSQRAQGAMRRLCVTTQNSPRSPSWSPRTFRIGQVACAIKHVALASVLNRNIVLLIRVFRVVGVIVGSGWGVGCDTRSNALFD